MESQLDHLVLKTVYGDILAKLDFLGAPLTSARFLRLVEQKHYDLIPIVRFEPGFLIQTGSILNQNHFESLPIEGGIHRRGSLTLAREDGVIQSKETSFSILLNDAPHLDGHYTVFGEVLQGMNIVERLVLEKYNSPKILSIVARSKQDAFTNLEPMSEPKSDLVLLGILTLGISGGVLYRLFPWRGLQWAASGVLVLGLAHGFQSVSRLDFLSKLGLTVGFVTLFWLLGRIKAVKNQ